MSRLKPYRKTQTILLIFLALMFLVGGAALTNSKGNYEWFPFYSWSMFALVPQEETIYRLTVQHPEQPEALIDFRQAQGLVNEPDSLPAYHLIQKIGNAIERQNLTEMEELRTAFDNRYLPAGILYQVWKTREDPLTAWKQAGDPQQGKAIGRFKAGQESR